MAKCWKCGKSGMFLSVGKSGLCVDCLETVADTALELISMIKRGGAQRKRALDMIDAEAAKDFLARIQEPLAESNFTQWRADTHATLDQIDRIRRSETVKILAYDAETGVATVKGSGKDPYRTTLDSCTCGDFTVRRLPCKHIYRLAAEHGGIDFLGYLDAE